MAKGEKNLNKKRKQNVFPKQVVVCTMIIFLSFSLPSVTPTVYVLTVRESFRCYPGFNVNIWGDLRGNGNGIPGATIRINVTAPNGTILFSGVDQTNDYGTYTVSFSLNLNATLGMYRVNVTSLEYSVWASTTFEVISRHSICGDCIADTIVNVGDIVLLIGYLFKEGPAPPLGICIADSNGDGLVEVGDIIYMINYLFKNGPAPSGCCR